jgi:hypothetical protein
MEEFIKRYDELYEDMATAKDPKKMMIFGDAEKWIFHEIAKAHPELAEKWLSKLEAGKWNNYLSESEAEHIANKIMNQDGTRGAHWDYDTFKGAVESLGAKMRDEPFYNCYALWIMANALWSDHHKSLSEFVPKEQEPKVYYLMAVEKLKDVDYPKFIRKYYDL